MLSPLWAWARCHTSFHDLHVDLWLRITKDVYLIHLCKPCPASINRFHAHQKSSMQLTKHTDFALRCLMYTGAQPADTLVTIPEIAQQFNISRNHLMKIVNQLGRLNYIETIRGSKGGIRLIPATLDIRLDCLIKDLENQLELVNCAEPLCPLKGQCALKQALDCAQAAFFQVLAQYTLAHLIQDSNLSRFLENPTVARLHTP